MSQQRILVWFSCGAPSAIAAKETIRRYGDLPNYEVLVVNCDTRPSEHSDNYRFSKQIEAWLGQPIIYIRNEDYKDIDEVFEKTHYMAGINGARCTTELKKVPRQNFARPDDIHVFGYTLEEQKRCRSFALRNPELRLKWVLVEAGLTKKNCLDDITRAGIMQPIMYELGFDNNNCPGCVKASSAWYWDRVRTFFPVVFKRRCEQSRKLGVRLVECSNEVLTRLTPGIVPKGSHQRIFLDELPPGPYRKWSKKKENLSCGPECGSPTP